MDILVHLVPPDHNSQVAKTKIKQTLNNLGRRGCSAIYACHCDLDLVHGSDVAGLDEIFEFCDGLLKLINRNFLVLNNANNLKIKKKIF